MDELELEPAEGTSAGQPLSPSDILAEADEDEFAAPSTRMAEQLSDVEGYRIDGPPNARTAILPPPTGLRGQDASSEDEDGGRLGRPGHADRIRLRPGRGRRWPRPPPPPACKPRGCRPRGPASPSRRHRRRMPRTSSAAAAPPCSCLVWAWRWRPAFPTTGPPPSPRPGRCRPRPPRRPCWTTWISASRSAPQSPSGWIRQEPTPIPTSGPTPVLSPSAPLDASTLGDLEQIDFFLEQGLPDEARALLDDLSPALANHAEVLRRRARAGTAAGGRAGRHPGAALAGGGGAVAPVQLHHAAGGGHHRRRRRPDVPRPGHRLQGDGPARRRHRRVRQAGGQRPSTRCSR